jgi:tetratricopeptide (TPR) repeat protein
MTANFEPMTTAGVIALGNLDARIDGQAWQAARGRLAVGERAELVELLALRAHLLGRIADAERAAALAEELVRQMPRDAQSFITRARMAAMFHRFEPALADLDTAAGLGAHRGILDGERAAIYQALGRYDEALALRRQALTRHAEFSVLGALAGLHAERGETAEAERYFKAARQHYRGISPFPLAVLDFQRGQMWMEHGDLHRARTALDAALRRLPAYVPAQGHLAEVEAALGDRPAAIARLHPLSLMSDDPEYAATLAGLLADSGQAGHLEEAEIWRVRAQARYEELIARHLGAFADHAAEFWLTIGGDSARALRLARQNLALRQTPRAHALLRRATDRAYGHVAGSRE